MVEKIRDAHVEEYAVKPEVIVCAPGRIHLIGEHSWFFKDKTLSLAVNLPVYVSISKRTDATLCFNFFQLKERKKINLTNLKFKKEDRWANIFKSMIYAYEKLGYHVCGMDVTTYSDVLPSAGFGITTAMKVCSAVAIKKLFKIPGDESLILDVIEIASKNFLNCEYYKSDIYTALFSKKGTCLLTDHEKGTYEYLPFNFEGNSLILTDSKVPRVNLWEESLFFTLQNKKLLDELKFVRNGNSIYEESLNEINEVFFGVGEDVRRRLLCVIRENQYLTDCVGALKCGNLNSFCKSILKSHEGLRDLYQISCPEIDWLVKRVQEFDVANSNETTSCARIIGKGFGHCTYTFIKCENVDNYMQKLIDYERIFGFHAITYVVSSENGALFFNEEGYKDLSF